MDIVWKNQQMMPVMMKCEELAGLLNKIILELPSQVRIHAAMLGVGAQGSTYIL